MNWLTVQMKKRLPDFFIIGASRSGTNSLRTMLNSVPEILPAKKREIHFFDDDGQYAKGLKHYESYFPEREVLLSFDTTPGYLYSRKAPIRIKRNIPEESHRFIVLLRNPVDRAWSHYWHWRNKIPKSALFDPFSEVLQRGRYVNYLRYWFYIFDRDCFLIIKSEEFFKQPITVANKVCCFLNLPSTVEHSYYYDPKKENPTVKSPYPKPDKKTFDFLTNYYRRPNQELFDLIGLNWE